LSAPFTLPAALTGFTLLSIGNFGLDQDTTQRLLACKDARSGSQGLYLSVFATIPVVAVFLAIGALLSVYYDRPDMTSHGARLARAGGAPAQRSDIAVLVRFILTETPPGIKGLATVGIAAAAMGTTMSALNAISSVLIQDFYRAWRSRRRWGREDDLVLAGRAGMAAAALMTLGMAVVSDLWRRATGAPLLEFVLSVMNFAYAGLLGVYFAAVFSNRGSSTSVIAALIGGFLVVLTLQPSLALALRAPSALTSLAFPWALCLGTITSFLICIVFDSRPRQSSIDPAQSHGRRSWSASP
jgi:Na+/proline symporter